MPTTQTTKHRAKRREPSTPEKLLPETQKALRLVSLESRDPETAARPRRGLIFAAGIAASLLCLAVYLLRLDQVVGLYGDDAWYVLLAKALATGHGYTLINSPSPGIVPTYPPAFAWLLSLVIRVAPEFPQNVWLLKSVSIAAMLGIGVAAYGYFARVRELPSYLALGLAVAVVIHPAFTFLATSTVMSECVFTLAQLLTVVVIERVVRKGRSQLAWHYVLLGAALASATFLMRSTGLVLMMAVVIYLLKERLMRAAVIFALGVAVLAGPWMVYARLHAPTAEQMAEQNSYIVESYAIQFWERTAGYGALGAASLGDLPERVMNNVIRILEYDGGALLLYPMYRTLELVEKQMPEGKIEWLSVMLCLLMIGGFIAAVRERLGLAELLVPLSLFMTVLWPFGPFRFILPLLPWALLYTAFGARAIYRFGARLFRSSAAQHQWAVIGSVVGCLAAISLYGNITYILQLQGPQAQRPVWVQAYEENVALYRWMGEQLPKEAVMAAQNPALLHLYTGHKTIGSWEPAKHWEGWKQLGVRYLVVNSSYPMGEPSPSEKRFPIIYRSDWMKLRVLDFGEAQSRQMWIDLP